MNSARNCKLDFNKTNNDTATMDSFVCYHIVINNEELSRVTTIKVKEGEYIDSITRGIKLQSNVLLASVDPTQIYLFESIESAEPLDPLTPWNSNVTWGKPETPMIVRVQPLAVAPWNNNEDEILQHRLDNGTNLSNLSDVFTCRHESFENHDSFVRRHHVADEYRKTVLAAENDKLTAAENSKGSQSQCTSQNVDIFGCRSPKAHSAHLLPNAHSCASFWFSVVPWVLNTGNNNLSWTFLQKCIHGSLQSETKGFVRRVLSAFTKRSSTRSRNDVKKKSVQRKNSSSRSDRSSQSRIALVGIKHFSTNRIRLVDQKTYFDDYPCVIIVPILSVEEVRSWNGGGYDAIVLAGDWEQENIDAATVYMDIRASHNMLQGNNLVESCLASEEQCITACHLLKQMILSVCDSAKGSTHLHVDLRNNEKYDEWNGYVSQLHDAPVPIINRWKNGNAVMKVRKVAFSASNPAPDPILLLAKATSNWLKRHQIEILPACGDADSDSSNCTDSFASVSEEEKIRGWSHMFTAAKKPRIAEVNICDNRRDVVAFDEPLSDDE